MENQFNIKALPFLPKVLNLLKIHVYTIIPVLLTAVAAESAPTISQGPQDTVVDLYDEVSLVCMASGNPQPTIQWFKDGQMIMEENSQTLTISSIDLPDRGLYSCTATNTQGSATSERAVVNIRGIQQYLMAVYVPSTSQPFTGVDLAQSSQLREAELLFLLEVHYYVCVSFLLRLFEQNTENCVPVCV